MPEYVVALTLEARRTQLSLDLREIMRSTPITEAAQKANANLRIVEESFAGKSLTVEMEPSFIPELQKLIPMAMISNRIERPPMPNESSESYTRIGSGPLTPEESVMIGRLMLKDLDL